MNESDRRRYEMQVSVVQFVFGEAAQQFQVKDTARENLRDEMSAISRRAKSMEYAFDGISDKFLFQRNMSDANMLANARSFPTESLAYNADFIAYGLPTTFRADLNADTADTSGKVREGMMIVRVLDGIVKNKYTNDPGKLAAWISASHVEKATKKQALPTP